MKLLEYFGRTLLVLTALVLAVVLPIASAFAQDSDIVVAVPPTEIVLNWGDWLAILLANLADPQSVAWTVVAGAIAWVVAKLPGPVQFAFNLFKVEQLLTKALQAGIGSTKGAVEGERLTLNVGSEVLAKALQYAIDNGAKAVIDWMGGPQGVEEKLIARMPLAATVDGASLVEGARALGGMKITDPVPRKS